MEVSVRSEKTALPSLEKCGFAPTLLEEVDVHLRKAPVTPPGLQINNVAKFVSMESPFDVLHNTIIRSAVGGVYCT
jgi:hypothetical protein